MSKAAELAALIGSQSSLSNRNLIINGAMNVSQRSVSETAQHTSGYITCDRFLFNFVNEDELRLTVTQEADGPSGFSNSLKLQTTTAESAVAADEELRVIYRAEGQDLQSLGFGTSAAKKFTVSFYVKSSVAATYGFNAYIYDANKVFGQAYTINSANTWERKSITFDANTASGITDDNTAGLQLNWFLMAGSDYTSGSNSSWETFATAKSAVGHTANAVATTTNATWQITGVQLEVGEQATPFEHRLFGDEYQRCLRYYYRTPAPNGGMSANETFPCIGNMDGTQTGAYMLQFPIPMRAAPSAIEQSGTASDYSIRVTSDANGTSVPTAGGFTAESALINLVSSGAGFTSGDACFMRAESTDAFLAFSAEL